VWSDEFDYTGLPEAGKWSYDVGGHGWGNQELQSYTERRLDNARVQDGTLIIEARRENWQGMEYTSARLVTKSKGDWTYGRFEISAKLPSGRGTWPAIWMLPTQWTYGNGGWPDNGEIDIMEHVGFDPGWVHGSVHTRLYYSQIGTQKTAKIRIPDAQSVFHVYALEWSAQKIEVYVDSTKYFTFTNEGKGWQTWPFDKQFHLLLNIAVGGGWGGAQGVDPSIFPQRMEVDYVRVYK
jgi:beta-glucanase (GH16 family)